MNPAPLSQPTPFICPHRAAGTEEEKFCSRCGAQFLLGSRLAIVRRWGLILEIITFVGIGALGVGCAIQDLNGDDFIVFTLIALPSLLVGLAGFVTCLRPLLKCRD